MRTPTERLDELEERMEQAERNQIVALSAAYEAFNAALQSLKDNRVIQGIHHKLAIEDVQKALNEKLSGHPELLDQLRYHYWPRRFRD